MGTVVVKLGSSIVADDSFAVREDVLEHVCDEVAALHNAGEAVALVTSGAIARGVQAMERPGRPTAMDELQALSAVGQGKLYRVYDEMLVARGTASAQVLLTFFDMSARTHYLNARQTLRKLLDWGVVPVINENDTTATDEISFGDNDFLAAQVAMLISADLLILLTDTAGLHTADPRQDPSAELVTDVRDFAELDAFDIGQASSQIGSGGMRSKVVAAEMAAAAGIAAVIADGTVPGGVQAAAAGEAVGYALPPAGRQNVEFQAVAQVRQAEPRDDLRRRRRSPSPARAGHQPAACRDRRGRGRFRRRRRGRGDRRWGRRRSDRQGDRQLQRGRAAPGDGDEDGRGARVAPTRERRSGPPRLLRPQLSPASARATLATLVGWPQRPHP